ncbi:BatA domain-containing protein [Fibrella aquatilis]|uniref:BatA domain-containing protein n=1 Tax=Fibrella aquatilis TaxID=2817059 RepID=A0A939G066_9BACT|nr:BatA domain-containing protein [Fibrella aquatilis]MBO0929952.1 BatA domain-containing protein [Fibrella aquatilis]
MTFLNPVLLWGILAIAVPIALHFWHQQRARPMPWAMLRWLETPTQPPKRGLRFDNLLLLVLRCLLLVVLACLLARPIWPGKKTATPAQQVHLVEPNRQLVSMYRFELAQAQQRDERLFWATQPLSIITALDELPPSPPLNPLALQAVIDEATAPQANLHLYLRNSSVWVNGPAFQVPKPFFLHPANSATENPSSHIALPSGKVLTLADNGRLAVTNATTTKAVTTAPIRVLVQLGEAAERASVLAALGALTQVYGLTYQLDEQSITNKSYTWIITDRSITSPNPATVYTLVGQPLRTDWSNVQYLPGPLTIRSNADIANGQLPEQLGMQLLSGLGLTSQPTPLSQQAFAALFQPAISDQSPTLPTAHPRNAGQKALLILFLSLLLAERWLSRRGA